MGVLQCFSNHMPVTSPLSEEASHWQGLLPCWWQWGIFSTPVLLSWSKADSETIGDSETAIQKLRFRNYCHPFRNYCDSETSAIQKLRFRNYCDSETTTPMELHIDLECPQGSDDFQIPSPMEHHIDLECPHRIRWYQNSHPHGTSHWLGLSTRIRWYPNSHPHGPSNWLGLFPQG